MKKKILLLGSDFGTLDMVLEAKKQGYYVIATDLMETSPSKEAADEMWKISTTDLTILEEKCRELDIKGIITGASDFNITCARQLCKRLNLPIYCENDYAWKVARDKSEFKKVCNLVGAPVAKGYTINDELTREQLDAIEYPVVVKPVDKSGNRGMSYCSNEAELLEAYKNARSVSSNPNIVCERQLHGPEWTVYYLLADGQAQLFYFAKEHHQPGELANLYTIMNSSSHHLKQYLEEMNDKVIEVFKQANFTEGLAWVETMLDDDGKFYLIECGYRFGGDMENICYEKVSGFNSIKWMIDTAVGKKHTIKDLPAPLTTAHKACSATYHLFANKDAIITKIEGLDKIEANGNVYVDMPKREGSKVFDRACMGIVRIYGETHLKMIEKIKYITDNLKIYDENGEELFIKFTDYKSISDDFEAGLLEFGVEA